MNQEILIALISAGSGILVAIISIIVNNRVIAYKVDTLAQQVKEHNQLVERTAVVERDVKTAFNRIDENRQDIKEVRACIKNN